MVDIILPNGNIFHNHPHAQSLEEYFRAYDCLFSALAKIRALSTAFLGVEPGNNQLGADDIYNYFWLLDDQAQVGDVALKELDRLQRFLVHCHCGCNALAALSLNAGEHHA